MSTHDTRLDELENLVHEGRTEVVLQYIRSGLPLQGQAPGQPACREFAFAFGMALKNSPRPLDPKILTAWVDKVTEFVPKEDRHTQLCRIFIPLLTKMSPSSESIRLLLEAIEGKVPDFRQRPVAESKLRDVTEGLRRDWKPGQSARTVLGIAADSFVNAIDIWQALIPDPLESLPMATSRMSLLEYLPNEPSSSTPASVVRERFCPTPEALSNMGEHALRRLSVANLPLFATGQIDGSKYPSPRPSAMGAIELLDAGAIIPDDAWIKLARLGVRTPNQGEAVTLFYALLKQVTARRNPTMGTITLKRMIESEQIPLNQSLDNMGSTALHIAAAGRNAEVAIQLLDHGADPSVQRADGLLPCDVAAQRKANPLLPVLQAAAAKAAMRAAILRRVGPSCST